MKKSLAAAAFALLLVPATVFAQEEGTTEEGGEAEAEASVSADTGDTAMGGIWRSGTMGLSFSPFGFINFADVISEAAPTEVSTANFLYFLGPRAALDVQLGIGITVAPDPNMPMDTATTFGFTLDVGYRMYRLQAGSLHTYLEPFIGLGSATHEDLGDNLAIRLGAGMGVDYFFTERFSIGGEIGLRLSLGGPANMGLGLGDNISLSTYTSGLRASFFW